MVKTEPGIDIRKPTSDDRDEKVAPEVARDGVSVRDEGDRYVVEVSGNAGNGSASHLVKLLRELDPEEHPLLTLDLREATELSPLVIHALLCAWERRWCQPGSIRVLTAPGSIQQYLDSLRLHNVLIVEHAGSVGELQISCHSSEEWEAAQKATVERLRTLLLAAQNRDLPVLKALARQATPLCVASGAPEGGTAFGTWCTHCPMTDRYGGCRPLMDQMLRAAAKDDWDVAELLIMALIGEAAACTDCDRQASAEDRC